MRSKLALIGIVIFNVINLGGGLIAVAERGPSHAIVHIALLLPGMYVMARLMRARRQEPVVFAHPIGDRIDHIQQSVDAIALEVERIGEGQRYAAKVMAERVKASQSGKDPHV